METITYANPVHDQDFADPFVFRHQGEYFAVGTTASNADARGVFPLLRSRDLVRWQAAGHALARPHPSLGDTYWAPEIAQRDGMFYLYYSVGQGDRGHHLRVATSARPEGPYHDIGVRLTPP